MLKRLGVSLSVFSTEHRKRLHSGEFFSISLISFAHVFYSVPILKGV